MSARLCAVLALMLLGLWAPRLAAHAGSTAWLQVEARERGLDLRWDLALRDADVAVGLDADGDGQITWGETRQATPQLLAYARERLRMTAAGQPCALSLARPLQVAERDGETYAVLSLQADCAEAVEPLRIDYTALFELDASHRALLRLKQADSEQSAVFAPDRQSYEPALSPGPLGTLARYFREGVEHVLSGWDHMLFLAALFLPAALRRESGRWAPARSQREVLLGSAALVTAFTLTHALTLSLAALGVLSLPSRWVESAVAASVLFAALNNLVPSVQSRLLWLVAGFGLIHGSAIAGALLELGLPAQGRVAALLGFNLGVEAAQLGLIALGVPLVYRLRRWRGYVPVVLWPGSVLIALAGLIWLLDRAFAMEWPLPI